MRQILHNEGIILHKIPYRNHDEIITVFTKDYGLIKLMVHGARSSKNSVGANTETLALTEFVFQTGSGDIWNHKESRLLNSQHELRKSLAVLQAAGDLVQAILHTQDLHHPSPGLYQLFLAFLKKLPEVDAPGVLTASFRLKLLKHEGVLSEERVQEWSESELDIVRFLTHSRSLNELASLSLPAEVLERIKALFHSSLQI